MAFLTGNGQTLQSRALELGAAWLVVANEARFKVWFGLVQWLKTPELQSLGQLG